MLYRAAVSLLVLCACAAHGFVATTAPRHLVGRSAVRMANEDPTGSPFIQAINALQEAIQTSPFANFKSKIAKMQAGDYDVASVKAALDGYISEPVMMFS